MAPTSLKGGWGQACIFGGTAQPPAADLSAGIGVPDETIDGPVRRAGHGRWRAVDGLAATLVDLFRCKEAAMPRPSPRSNDAGNQTVVGIVRGV